MPVGWAWAAGCLSDEISMYEGPIQDLIDELGRLPGIGPKSAQRLAFHVLAADRDDVLRLADVLKLVKETVKFCEICFNVSEDTQCRICRDPRRDETIICVVEEAKDVVAVGGDLLHGFLFAVAVATSLAGVAGLAPAGAAANSHQRYPAAF